MAEKDESCEVRLRCSLWSAMSSANGSVHVDEHEMLGGPGSEGRGAET